MYKVNLISKNRSYKHLSPVGVVLHSTDTPGATDENEQSYFNNNKVNASAHAFVDWDSITQTVPYDEQAWHAGPTANRQFIGVELCEPNGRDPDKFTAVTKLLIPFLADLFMDNLKIHTVTKDNLLSHADVSNRWHETDHQDPVEYLAKYGWTMDMVRSKVQEEINRRLLPSVVDCTNELIWRGIISDQKLWNDRGNKEQELKGVFQKYYPYIIKNGGSVKNGVKDIGYALNVLCKWDIVTDRVYWEKKASQDGNIKSLLCKMADYIN